jgi:hypothetical protein
MCKFNKMGQKNSTLVGRKGKKDEKESLEKVSVM